MEDDKWSQVSLGLRLSRHIVWPSIFGYLKTCYNFRKYFIEQNSTFNEIQREVFVYGDANRREDLEFLILNTNNKDFKFKEPLVYFHGGGWQVGSWDWYSEFLTPFVLAGHPVFNVNYALAPEHRFPNSIISTLKLLNWILNFKPKQNFSTETVTVMGDSAGGNIAIMTGIMANNTNLIKFITSNDELANQKTPIVSKIVGLYSACDREESLKFPQADELMWTYVGPTALDKTLTPRNTFMPMDLDFKEFPNTLLLCGTADELYTSNLNFYEFLKKKNTEKVQLITYEGEEHGLLNRYWRPNSKKLVNDIIQYLR